MRVSELIGSKVWVKGRDAGEFYGHILSVPKPFDLEDIESSILASTFRIELTTGDVIETSGFNLTAIENNDYSAIVRTVAR